MQLSVQKRHLIFIGMMGTGKSTIGRIIAHQLKLPWWDTDQEIEKELKMTVAEYFQHFGEKAFREKETDIIKKLVTRSPSVITTGGGIVLRKENRTLLKEHGWVIHLTAHPEVIIQRLKHDQTRPLIQGNLRQKIYQLVKERADFYQFADQILDTDTSNVNEIVEIITHAWETD